MADQLTSLSALSEQMRGERAIQKVLNWADEEFLEEVLANLRAGIDVDIAGDFAELPANFENRLEEVYEDQWLLVWASTGRKVEKALRRWGGSIWTQASKRSAFSAESDATTILVQAEAQITFAPPTEAVERYMAQRIPPLRRVHSQTLKRAVRDVVAQGRLRGEPLRVITQGIKRRFPAATQFRATNIARTESSQLWNDASMARYRSSGTVQGFEFMAVMDDRTTEICAWYNGMKFRLGEGETPPLHFMCRSTTIPILWFEDAEWSTATAPPESRPLPGFGGPRALDIPNVTAADHFATVRAGLDVAEAARVVALIEAAEQTAIREETGL